jgi:hypothetical protein
MVALLVALVVKKRHTQPGSQQPLKWSAIEI